MSIFYFERRKIASTFHLSFISIANETHFIHMHARPTFHVRAKIANENTCQAKKHLHSQTCVCVCQCFFEFCFSIFAFHQSCREANVFTKKTNTITNVVCLSAFILLQTNNSSVHMLAITLEFVCICSILYRAQMKWNHKHIHSFTHSFAHAHMFSLSLTWIHWKYCIHCKQIQNKSKAYGTKTKQMRMKFLSSRSLIPNKWIYLWLNA